VRVRGAGAIGDQRVVVDGVFLRSDPREEGGSLIFELRPGYHLGIHRLYSLISVMTARRRNGRPSTPGRERVG
jgi:hypothetical protein